jgi:uncharacterized protein (DUF1697 family)
VTKYVALLRGINVGKNNRISMGDLRAMLSGLGHTEVATLLQSGNVVFSSPSTDESELAEAIEKQIAADLDLKIGVVVCSQADLARVVRDNPFAAEATDPSRYLVTFLSDDLNPDQFADLDPATYEPELFAFGPREIYLWMPDGIIESRLAKVFSGKRMGTTVATARNWNTVTKLLAMME